MVSPVWEFRSHTIRCNESIRQHLSARDRRQVEGPPKAAAGRQEARKIGGGEESAEESSNPFTAMSCGLRHIVYLYGGTLVFL